MAVRFGRQDIHIYDDDCDDDDDNDSDDRSGIRFQRRSPGISRSNSLAAQRQQSRARSEPYAYFPPTYSDPFYAASVRGDGVHEWHQGAAISDNAPKGGADRHHRKKVLLGSGTVASVEINRPNVGATKSHAFKRQRRRSSPPAYSARGRVFPVGRERDGRHEQDNEWASQRNRLDRGFRAGHRRGRQLYAGADEWEETGLRREASPHTRTSSRSRSRSDSRSRRGNAAMAATAEDMPGFQTPHVGPSSEEIIIRRNNSHRRANEPGDFEPRVSSIPGGTTGTTAGVLSNPLPRERRSGRTVHVELPRKSPAPSVATSPSLSSISLDSDDDSASDFRIDFILEKPSTSLSDESSTNKGDRWLDTDSPGMSTGWYRKPPTMHRVMLAQYLRHFNPLGKGTASGELSVLHSDSSSRRKGLYRWIHFEHAEMCFDAYRDAVKTVQGISDEHRTLVCDILDNARQCHLEELPRQHDVNGRYLSPHCISGQDIRRQAQARDRARHTSTICFPYFTIAKYPAEKSDANSALHPARPLLQSQFSSAKREQDLQQAFCALPRPKGIGRDRSECFQIAQLWCTVLKDGLLLTCSTLSSDELCMNILQRKDVPNTELSLEKSATPDHVQIRQRAAELLWLLPRQSCGTWLELTRTLTDMTNGLNDAGLSFDLHHKGINIDALRWTEILETQRASDICLDLVLKRQGPKRKPRANWKKSQEKMTEAKGLSALGPKGTSSESKSVDAAPPTILQPPPNGLNGSTRSTDLSSPQPAARPIKESIHIFTWLGNYDDLESCSGTKSPGPSGFTTSLATILDQAHDFLMHHKSNDKICSIYRSVKPTTFAEVKSSVEEIPNARSTEPGYHRSGRNQLPTLIWEAIQYCLEAFVPLETNAAIMGKVWGMLHRMFKRGLDKTDNEALQQFRRILDESATALSDIRDSLATARPGLGSKETIEEFMKAFICLVNGMGLAAGSGKNLSDALRYMRRSSTMASQAMDKFLSDLGSPSIGDHEAVLPYGIVLLIISRLIGDVVGGRLDLTETYWTYYKHLELKVEQDPYTRTYQPKLGTLRHEISAVLHNLQQQKAVLQRIKETMQTDRSEVAPLKTTIALSSGWSSQDLIIEDCLDRVKTKISGFKELLNRTMGLQDWNLSQIENNKSRHDAAIYAFTIVTIIFLPLSFVSSVLGMNTSDIRDMDQGQWVFWVSGLGLTLIVVIVALSWAGEFRNAQRELVRLLNGDWKVAGPVNEFMAGNSGGGWQAAPSAGLHFQLSRQNDAPPTEILPSSRYGDHYYPSSYYGHNERKRASSISPPPPPLERFGRAASLRPRSMYLYDDQQQRHVPKVRRPYHSRSPSPRGRPGPDPEDYTSSNYYV